MKEEKKKVIYDLLALVMLGIYGVLWLKKDVFTARITLAALAVIMGIYCKKYFKIAKVKGVLLNRKNWYQIGTIAFFVLVFFICAIVNKVKTGMEIPNKIYLILGILAVITFGIFVSHIKERQKAKKISFDLGIIIVVAVTILSRIPMFTRIQMWDGAIYYEKLQWACINFDFSLASVLNGFRLAGHFTWAYTFFMAMGEFLIPGEVIGVQIIMLVMTTIAFICIYKMFQEYWCNMSKLQAAVMTSLVSVIPLVCGLFSVINLDYFLFVFFIYLIYAEHKNWEIMRLFWMACVILTKETGLFIIAGYSIVYILLRWEECKELKAEDRVLKLLEDNLIKSVAIALMALCCFVIIQGGLFTWMGIGQKSNKELFANYIGAANGKNLVLFIFSFIVHKTVQIFTMNFTWIPTLLILHIGFKARKEKKQIPLQGMVGVLGALIVFLLFSIFSTILIASTVSRYIIFSAALLWIVAIVLWFGEYGLNLGNQKQRIVIGVLFILLVAQNFVYIDPVTNLWFDRLDTGKGKMVSGEKDYNNYGDTFVNNNYYRYIELLLDELLCEIDYDEEWQIVMPYKRDYIYIPGNGDVFKINWDIENKCRTLSKVVDKKTIPIDQLELRSREMWKPEMIKSKAIVYFMPYIECDEKEIFEELEMYYEIGEKMVITNWGGSIIYYELEYKPTEKIAEM